MYLALWTRKVLCGSFFMCHIQFFIYSFIYKRFRRTLFIRTKLNMRILGVITVKWWKTQHLKEPGESEAVEGITSLITKFRFLNHSSFHCVVMIFFLLFFSSFLSPPPPFFFFFFFSLSFFQFCRHFSVIIIISILFFPFFSPVFAIVIRHVPPLPPNSSLYLNNWMSVMSTRYKHKHDKTSPSIVIIPAMVLSSHKYDEGCDVEG